MNSLIGKNVINIHRVSCDTSERRVGTIVGFAAGVNGGTRVQWTSGTNKSEPYEIEMVTSDLALDEDWPRRQPGQMPEYIRLSTYPIEVTLPDA